MSIPKWLRHRSRFVLATVGVALVGVAAAVAYAQSGVPAIQTITPKSEKQITNIDVLRQQIKNYYGAPLATTGPSGSWTDPLNLDSNYAREARFDGGLGGLWLKARQKSPGKKVALFDVDDTTLTTFNYELFSNWDFNFLTNLDFVLNERFPAVPGMVDVINRAKAEGYRIVFLTGRPGLGQSPDQEPATLQNLLDVGYPMPSALPEATLGGGSDGIFTKPAVADYPPYLQTACADEIAAGKSCTTIHYKSATRAYIESLGYRIVASFGDQFSDFSGGHAERTFKMPNPSYFLP